MTRYTLKYNKDLVKGYNTPSRKFHPVAAIVIALIIGFFAGYIAGLFQQAAQKAEHNNNITARSIDW